MEKIAPEQLNPEFLEYVYQQYRKAAIRWMFRLENVSTHCTARVFALESRLDSCHHPVERKLLVEQLYDIWVCIAEDVYEQFSAANLIVA